MGEAHAEVNAIASVKNQKLLTDSTVYVTLEPCSHHGKTPPCVNLLIRKKVKKVIVACEDPYPKVAGNGIRKLREAGIGVDVGLLAYECEKQNRRFLTYHKHHRPYVILKWAQTRDGFMARENHDSKWISNAYSRQLVHLWRSQEDSILVGKNTILYDDPTLTVRKTGGRNPTRVVMDRNRSLDMERKIFNAEAPTIIFNELTDEVTDHNQWIALDKLTPQNVLEALCKLSLQSIIVEGGSHIMNSFIRNGCWNEARIFTSDSSFTKGIKAPDIKGELIRKASIFGVELKVMKNPTT